MHIRAEALLFDNDGTLVSTTESAERCWWRWAQEQDIGAAEFARVEMHGRPAAEIVADFLPAPRVAEGLARIEQLEIEDAAGGVALLPGTTDLLAALPDRRWAVVTSATARLGRMRLAGAGITAAHIVSADDVTRGKPDPEPYLLAARRLGVDPARCVVFEDAPAGLAAGRAAGMTTVALTTTHPRDELDADFVVPDLAAVSAQVTEAGVELALAGLDATPDPL